jgi:hypothetical protein
LSQRPNDPHKATADVESDRVVLDDNRVALSLFGEKNANLKRIELETGARIHSRGNELTFLGPTDAIAQARRLVEQLYHMVRSGRPVGPEAVTRAAHVLRGDANANLHDVFSDTILVGSRARPIAPKGLAQKRYVDAIREHDIVVAIGPAGTGKTYLAMALALRELMEKWVKRIVLTRPALEAGERPGFLPGSMEEKVSPYLRPLYDALHDMMDFDRVHRLVERGMIEIAPITDRASISLSRRRQSMLRRPRATQLSLARGKLTATIDSPGCGHASEVGTEAAGDAPSKALVHCVKGECATLALYAALGCMAPARILVDVVPPEHGFQLGAFLPNR